MQQPIQTLLISGDPAELYEVLVRDRSTFMSTLRRFQRIRPRRGCE